MELSEAPKPDMRRRIEEARLKGLVVAKDISFSYRHRLVLQGVSLSLPKGSVGAVLGPNGAGKSTLLKVLSGYLFPTKGMVLIRGQDIHRVSHQERSSLVTYTGDSPRPSFDFTVEEAVMMGRMGRMKNVFKESAEDRRALEMALRILDLEELRERPVTSLSSGELQRVEMARALCQDPEVFLLDEPTAHLDMSFELDLMEIITRMAREKGKTILAVFHDLNLAMRYAQILFFLQGGRIAYSLRPSQVSPDVIEEVYGVKAGLFFNSDAGSWFVIPIESKAKKRVET